MQVIPKSIAILATVLVLTGCASMGEIARLEDEIAKAQEDAEAAVRQVRTAELRANEAIALVKQLEAGGLDGDTTRVIAEEALRKAEEAKAEAAKANKRAERMFKKSLSK